MSAEHPFAQYVRIVARGPGRSRALTQEEAREAMRMIVAGEAEPAQIGALLMLMRYRQESPAELAGFVEALRASFTLPRMAAPVDLDWPTYAAGRTRGEPWFLLAALLLAENGVRIAMHGPVRPASALAGGLAALGVSESGPAVGTPRGPENFTFLKLDAFSPALARLLALRDILGLRSAANSVARLLNPFGAPAILQGVFHPAYRELHCGAAVLLGQPGLAVFKGGGGEAERNPDKVCRVLSLSRGRVSEEEWPLLSGESILPGGEPSGVSHPLIACWRGELPGAARVVIATAAVALRLLGRARSPTDSDGIARQLWEARDKSRYSQRLSEGGPLPSPSSANFFNTIGR